LQGVRGVVQHRAAEPHRLHDHRAAAARRVACEAQGCAVVPHGLQDHVASEGYDLSGILGKITIFNGKSTIFNGKITIFNGKHTKNYGKSPYG